MSDEWYCLTLGQELGPMPLADLAQLVRQGHVVGTDKVRIGSDGEMPM